MKVQLGLKAWATGALVLAAASACGGTRSDPPPTSTAASTTSAEASSPTTSSPSDEAAAQVSALMHRYFAILDGVRQDPTRPITTMASVMTSIELKTEQRLVAQERKHGDHQTGNTRIADLTIQAVNLDNSDPTAGQVPTVTVDVCWDVSNVDVVDPSGHSIVLPSRPAKAWTRYIVSNYNWTADPSGGWRVSDGTDLKQAPCDS